MTGSENKSAEDIQLDIEGKICGLALEKLESLAQFLKVDVTVSLEKPIRVVFMSQRSCVRNSKRLSTSTRIKLISYMACQSSQLSLKGEEVPHD